MKCPRCGSSFYDGLYCYMCTRYQWPEQPMADDEQEMEELRAYCRSLPTGKIAERRAVDKRRLAKYYEKKKEILVKKSKDHYQKHKKEKSEYYKQWLEAHREERIAYLKEYHKQRTV